MKLPGAGLFGRAAALGMLLSCSRTAAVSIDQETRVVLERTACLGPCPVYTVSIAGDGAVTYFGEAHVRVQGPASRQVPRSSVQSLVEQMLEADFRKAQANFRRDDVGSHFLRLDVGRFPLQASRARRSENQR